MCTETLYNSLIQTAPPNDCRVLIYPTPCSLCIPSHPLAYLCFPSISQAWEDVGCCLDDAMLIHLPQCLNVRPVEVRAFLVMAHGCKCQVRHVADESVCRPVSHMDHIHMHTHRQTLTHANTMTRSNTHILTHTNAQRQIPYTHIHTGMHIQCNMQTHTHRYKE